MNTSRKNMRRECETALDEYSTRHMFSRHPAKAGIQYSRDASDESRSCGVLDRPVKPDDDSLFVRRNGLLR
jgi:hypothetical protein